MPIRGRGPRGIQRRCCGFYRPRGEGGPLPCMSPLAPGARTLAQAGLALASPPANAQQTEDASGAECAHAQRTPEVVARHLQEAQQLFRSLRVSKYLEHTERLTKALMSTASALYLALEDPPCPGETQHGSVPSSSGVTEVGARAKAISG